MIVTITCPKCHRAFRVRKGTNWTACPLCTKPEKKR